MKWLSFVLCCCLLLVGGAPTAAKPKEKGGQELKWAKGIARDFWDAMTDYEVEQASGLLSPECSQHWQGDGLSHHIWEIADGSKLTIAYTSEVMAPDNSEAVFKGTLSAKNLVKADFTLRIAKESGGGKWSIRFIRFKERASTPPPASPAPAPARSPDTPPSPGGSGDGSGSRPAPRADSAPRPSR